MKKNTKLVLVSFVVIVFAIGFIYLGQNLDLVGLNNPLSQVAAVGTSKDKAKPTVPTDFLAVGGEGVSLSWATSTDNVAVAGYNILRSNVYIGTTTATSFVDGDGVVNKAYSYKIRAFDTSGNYSFSTSLVSKSLTPVGGDNVAPTTPTNVSATASGTKAVLKWVKSTDNVGVKGYTISRDGVDIATTTAVTYSDATGVANMAYSYSVRAFDSVGNISSYSPALSVQLSGPISWNCVISAPPASYGLDPFYKKFCLVAGIPVVSSGAVSDTALKSVASMMQSMLVKRPDAVKQMVEKKLKVAIIGKSEVTTDIPEYRNLYKQFPGTDWNKRTRGIGATSFIPVSSVGEENVLCLSTDSYKGESIFVHEFAHSFAALGIIPIDSSFNQKLSDAYTAARAKGLWDNTYAASSKEEYFAEGVQSFFGSNLTATPSNGIHNNINGSASLKTYDSALHTLITSVYKTSWTWSCPK